MTFEEYVKSIRNTVDTFEKVFPKKHPDVKDLPQGEWDEQFEDFIQTQESYSDFYG